MIHEMILNLVVPCPQHEGFFMRAVLRPTQSPDFQAPSHQSSLDFQAPSHQGSKHKKAMI